MKIEFGTISPYVKKKKKEKETSIVASDTPCQPRLGRQSEEDAQNH